MSIDPDEMCFWFRGWFAGWLRPVRNGPGLRETDIVAVEDAANVYTLRAALDRAIARAADPRRRMEPVPRPLEAVRA
jgi:hypothetical protein